jgi:hypothetical protein
MTHRSRVLFGVMAAAIAVTWTSSACRAQDASTGQPEAAVARTAWGDPDLHGTWRNFQEAPFERPRHFGNREFLTDAELAARQKAKDDEYARLVAGRLETYDSGGLKAHNANWSLSDERPRPPSRRTSAIIDPPNGRLPPWTPEALKRWEAKEAATVVRGLNDYSYEDRGLSERCLTAVGSDLLGFQFGKGQTRQILQSPGYVAVVLGENAHYRMIPVDQRPPLGSNSRQWRGEARGRWDGNTLVVETTNFNDKQQGGVIVPSYRGAIYRLAFFYPGPGEQLRITERYTRTGPDTLEYRYTVEDPQTFTRPYTALYELTRDDDYLILPDQCHESNDGLAGQLAGAAADPKHYYDERIQFSNERLQRIEDLKAEWAAWREGRTYIPPDRGTFEAAFTRELEDEQ